MLHNPQTFISVVQGPLTVFSARSRWHRNHVCLVRGEAGLGLTLRGDAPVLVAGVLLGGCAAVRLHRCMFCHTVSYRV